MPAKKMNGLEKLLCTYLATGWLMAGVWFGYGVFTDLFRGFPEGIGGVMILLTAPVFVPVGAVMVFASAAGTLWEKQEYGLSLLYYGLVLGVFLLGRGVWHVLFGRQQKLAGQIP